MEFLGMGMGEVLVILLVAIVVMGPRRITEVGRTMGKIVGSLRRATFDLTAQVRKELEEQDKEPEHPVQHGDGEKSSGGQ